jgi:hypothetical protein
VPQDKAQVGRLYQTAADHQSHAHAQHAHSQSASGIRLSTASTASKGVRCDMGSAVALYRLAIAEACADANAPLLLCSEKGRSGPLGRAEAERLPQLVVLSHQQGAPLPRLGGLAH